MKNVFKKSLVLSALAILGLSSQAFAGTATSNLTVTATLSASCTLATAPVAFGTITPAATGTATATGTVNVTCSNGAPFSVAMNKGSGTSIAARSMAGTGTNTDRLAYNVYTTAGATSVWGDGTSSSVVVSSNGTGTAQTLNVYGTLALNQYFKADSYSDSVTVTLTY